MKRSAGILLHISSLPSKWGVGTLGEEAYKFADFLQEAGQTYWQILPIGPTSLGDSPYQVLSMYAGNPYFIDLDMLAKDGLLSEDDYKNIDWGNSEDKVHYGKLYENRFKVLRIAYKNGKAHLSKELNEFKEEQKDWIDDYALFMSVKNYFGGKPWIEWPDEGIKLRKEDSIALYKEKLKDDINFWCFVQYLFFKQWYKFKSYVNSNGIKIIGDIPIYVAMDSADTWSKPENFWLDENLKPVCVAGAPPDAFAKSGQLWGNPIYDWEYLKKSGYRWWIDRVKSISKMFDVTRIDHFRGFESYYAIPADHTDAINGTWKKGPGFDFFEKLNAEIGHVDIIAEDLGFVTKGVEQLLKDTGYPGMKILTYGFDSDSTNPYLPHMYERNYIVYIGTHDNDTALGWMKKAPKNEVDYAKQYCHMVEGETYSWAFIRTAYASVADAAIIQMQDILDLDNSARMNVPSTLDNNWRWRLENDVIDLPLAEKLHKLSKLYGRIVDNKKA